LGIDPKAAAAGADRKARRERDEDLVIIVRS
jgi:hypothetical protein